MSGFVGILHRDGRPVDPGQLRSLTEALRFRGPDGLRTWHRGSVGLGHTLFVTHAARDGEPQPIGLDDRYWIVGHIRLDAREDLISALRHSDPCHSEPSPCHSERSEESRSVSDAALVLHAYRTWGPECLKRIHGDFSFGIWDEAERRLFCARDPFGVRPFFYAQFDDLFLFGNTLNCLRQHPRVSSRLYEPALADYLVVGNLLELDRSFFADIRRLQPAHALTVVADSMRVQRHWDLPVEDELRYRDPAQYVEQFKELLRTAVTDRSVPGTVALFMSGGLDSGCLAATLTGRFGAVANAPAMRAFTVGWNCAFSDPEPAAARNSAESLGCALTILEAEDCEPLKDWDLPGGAGPEPSPDLYRQRFVSSLRTIAASARVALNGQGGDELLYPQTVLDELRRVSRARPLLDALRSWRASGTRPAVGLRRLLRGHAATQLPATTPPWIDSGWRSRLGLAERFAARPPKEREQNELQRSGARRRLLNPVWQAYLETFDPGASGVPLETAWPFLDQRLVRFALRLPPFPWCVNKYLERAALLPILGERAAMRAKTPLRGDPFGAWLAGGATLASKSLAGRLPTGWVDVTAWEQACAAVGPASPPDTTWQLARVAALARWLPGLATTPASPAIAAA